MAVLETNELLKTKLTKNQHRLTKEEIEQLKIVTLEILSDVTKLCEDNHIPYMLGGGTALGAVRHKGFIPWDDDIDINIPRKYVHTICELIRSEFPKKYYIEEPIYTKGYLSSFVQIHKNGTIFREFLAQDIEHCGIKIDIFPIENTYSNSILRFVHGVQCELGLLILSCYRMFAWRKEMIALAGTNKRAKALICAKGVIGCLFAPMHEWWYRRIQLSFQKCKEEDSAFVVIPSGRKHFFGEIYSRKEYMETIPVQFENITFPISKDYDRYLTNLYGDYMVLPPEEKREHHVLYQLKF